MNTDFDLDVAGIRAALGLSQAELAEAMQVDQSTISLWETRKTKPRGPARQVLLRLMDEHRAGQTPPDHETQPLTGTGP